MRCGEERRTTFASSLFIEPGRLRRIFRDVIVPHLSNKPFCLDRASRRVRPQRMRHKRIVKIGMMVLYRYKLFQDVCALCSLTPALLLSGLAQSAGDGFAAGAEQGQSS